MKKTIAIVTPPFIADFFTQPAGPILSACLKRAGFEAKHVDINVEFYRYLRSFIAVKELANPHGQSNPVQIRDSFLMYFANKYFSEFCEGEPAYRQYIVAGKESIEHLSPDLSYGFGFTGFLKAPRPICAQFIKDEARNLHHRFYEDTKWDARLAESCDQVGLSLIAPAQFVPAMTLAWRLKRLKPKIRIVLGGAWVTMFVEDLVSAREFAELFDVVIQGEGETPLLELMRAEGAEALEGVPNAHVKRADGTFSSPRRFAETDMNGLPAPDYAGLPLDDYSVPRPVLLQTARGCYWNKCAFCVHTFANKRYKIRRLELVLSDIDALMESCRPRFIVFTDLCHPANRMEKISEWIIQKGHRVNWFVFMRFEDSLTRDVLGKMREAGCDRIAFGLESANELTLRTIRKGHKMATVKRILEDCHALGVKTVLNTMVGLPGESREDAMDTLAFLRENQDRFFEAHVEIFRLEKDSDIYNRPEAYGISLDKSRSAPFDNSIDFRNGEGKLQSDEALELANRTVYSYYREKPGSAYVRKSMRSLTHAYPEPSVFEAVCRFPFQGVSRAVTARNVAWDILEPVEAGRLDPPMNSAATGGRARL